MMKPSTRGSRTRTGVAALPSDLCGISCFLLLEKCQTFSREAMKFRELNLYFCWDFATSLASLYGTHFNRFLGKPITSSCALPFFLCVYETELVEFFTAQNLRCLIKSWNDVLVLVIVYSQLIGEKYLARDLKI